MSRTRYSNRIKGDRGNFDWPARFDWTTGGGGYLGITQMDGDEVKDRVLLSPKQVEELAAFIEANRRKRAA